MEGVAALSQTFLGQILEPGAPTYDDARKIHNGLIDKRPALIARCRGTGRHRRCGALRPRPRTRNRGSWRRSQRRRPGDSRRRVDDRSVADEERARERRASGARLLRAG